MELLQFVFSSFWVWLGCVVLIVAAGEAVATAAAGFRQKRKVSVYHVGDKIGMRKNACAVGGRTLDVIVERTITDIVCMHSVKAGTVKFLYELDNDGRLVEIVR